MLLGVRNLKLATYTTLISVVMVGCSGGGEKGTDTGFQSPAGRTVTTPPANNNTTPPRSPVTNTPPPVSGTNTPTNQELLDAINTSNTDLTDKIKAAEDAAKAAEAASDASKAEAMAAKEQAAKAADNAGDAEDNAKKGFYTAIAGAVLGAGGIAVGLFGRQQVNRNRDQVIEGVNSNTNARARDSEIRDNALAGGIGAVGAGVAGVHNTLSNPQDPNSFVNRATRVEQGVGTANQKLDQQGEAIGAIRANTQTIIADLGDLSDKVIAKNASIDQIKNTLSAIDTRLQQERDLSKEERDAVQAALNGLKSKLEADDQLNAAQKAEFLGLVRTIETRLSQIEQRAQQAAAAPVAASTSAPAPAAASQPAAQSPAQAPAAAPTTAAPAPSAESRTGTGQVQRDAERATSPAPTPAEVAESVDTAGSAQTLTASAVAISRINVDGTAFELPADHRLVRNTDGSVVISKEPATALR